MKNRALAVIATGEYNQYVQKLVETANLYFGGEIYLFTDHPAYNYGTNVFRIGIPHYGWPKMPLMRWEIFRQHKEVFTRKYIYMVDADVEFMRPLYSRDLPSVQSKRVGVLHRNITRYRQDFNYETRPESTAYVGPDEGEKYYACGFCGGEREEFLRMTEVLADNIKQDVYGGIRALWGDESHINRYFIDHPPTLTLPPNYMCPEANEYFVPFIQHQDKGFKRVEKKDAEKYLTINPGDYKDLI